MGRAVFAFCLAVAVAPMAAQAQGSFARTAEASIDSAYIFRGTQRAGATLFAEGEVVLNGVYFGGLLAAPFGGDGADTLPDELRGYVGYSPHFEDRGSPFDLDFGVTAYAFLNDSDVINDDTRVEVYGGVIGMMPLNPAVYGYYDFELEAFTVQAGLMEFVPLGGLRGLEVGADIGHVEPDQGDGFSYAEAGADLIQGFGGGLEGFVGARAGVNGEGLFFEDLTATGPQFGDDYKAWVSGGVRLTF